MRRIFREQKGSCGSNIETIVPGSKRRLLEIASRIARRNFLFVRDYAVYANTMVSAVLSHALCEYLHSRMRCGVRIQARNTAQAGVGGNRNYGAAFLSAHAREYSAGDIKDAVNIYVEYATPIRCGLRKKVCLADGEVTWRRQNIHKTVDFAIG